ncbi:hypothetical protein VO419_004805 [Vibrio parahaemolyticus]|nr:hypothetical protein [Vibrio parahaemolyticus]
MNPKDTYAQILSKEIHAEICPNGALTTNRGALETIQNQRLYNYFLEQNLNAGFFLKHRGKSIIVPVNYQQLTVINWLCDCAKQAKKQGVTLKFKPTNSPLLSNKLKRIERRSLQELRHRKLLA